MIITSLGRSVTVETRSVPSTPEGWDTAWT